VPKNIPILLVDDDLVDVKTVQRAFREHHLTTRFKSRVMARGVGIFAARGALCPVRRRPASRPDSARPEGMIAPVRATGHGRCHAVTIGDRAAKPVTEGWFSMDRSSALAGFWGII
jgi:hypothetical protein